MMKLMVKIALLSALLLIASVVFAANSSEQCLSCHDYGVGSPVHPMLSSKHGDVTRGDTPMATDGCASCHGDSLAHSRAPTKYSPGVSFGPRWSGTVALQNKQCLQCHQENVAAHWAGGTHQQKNLTCVTCHDMHTRDLKLLHGAQTTVCTTCHKPQKDGMHRLHQQLDKNPNCTLCHNQHADAKPKLQLLLNRSEGCRSCHDLVAMSNDKTVSEKANSYHRTMAQLGRTCIDCHQGIAHAVASTVEPIATLPANSRRVTLFYPGQSDLNWVLNEHSGSQSVRQGQSCTQCHKDEELNMAANLGAGKAKAFRQIDVSFSLDADSVVLTLAWDGARADKDVAVMWSNGSNREFKQAGCWAACHSDMTGMSRDRGQGGGKYLSISRALMQRIGQPAKLKTPTELAALTADNQFVSVWRLRLNQGQQGKLQVASLLADLQWQSPGVEKASSHFQSGRWVVQMRRPRTAFSGANTTFGIALHGENGDDAGHWVSLPMTFAISALGVDFVAR